MGILLILGLCQSGNRKNRTAGIFGGQKFGIYRVSRWQGRACFRGWTRCVGWPHLTFSVTTQFDPIWIPVPTSDGVFPHPKRSASREKCLRQARPGSGNPIHLPLGPSLLLFDPFLTPEVLFLPIPFSPPFSSSLYRLFVA